MRKRKLNFFIIRSLLSLFLRYSTEFDEKFDNMLIAEKIWPNNLFSLWPLSAITF